MKLIYVYSIICYKNFSDDCSIIGNVVYGNNANGILLDSSDRNYVFNNTAYQNQYVGIRLHRANENTISYNYLFENAQSIWLFEQNTENFITYNHAFNNSISGISVYLSDWNFIENNVFNKNNIGIEVDRSTKNEITDNSAFDNYDSGIKLSSSNYNIISRNDVHNNAMNGINLGDSDHNIISDNIIENNPNEGIYLENSDYNTIMRNQFVSGPNANDHGSNNIFILNYWSGWTSPDADGDGIVDNPYSFGTNQDLYPLVSPDVHAFAPPSISSPSGGSSLSGTITIRWITAVDSFDHPITYTVYYSSNGGSSWVSLQTGLTSTSYEWNTKTVTNGNTYLVRVVATCSEGLTKEDISGQFTINNVEPTTTTTTTTSTPTPSWNVLFLLLSLFTILSWRQRKKYS